VTSLPTWLSPVYDAEEMRAMDAWAIDDQGVSSLALMESAGDALARVAGELSRPGPVRVVCGKGNNGGDGLVAARLLDGSGYDVEVLLLWPSGALSPDSGANLERFDGNVRETGPDDLCRALQGSGVVIDAILGTGFSGAPRSPVEEAIAAINGAGSPIVAADIASGVDAASGEIAGAAVEADATVTFHGAKLGQWIAPGKWHAGKLHLAEIGIPAGGPVEPGAGLIEAGVLGLAPRRGQRSNKFTSGQVLVIGGSRGLTGAVCMAAGGAIRAGAGYATVAVPASLEAILEVKLTEVMSIGCPGPDGSLGPEAAEAILAAAERAAAVVLGPGLGRADATFELARALAERIAVPLLIDADGLNALSGRLELLRERTAPTVLTPHAGELARLLERSADEVSAHRLASAREAARRSGAVIVLKGDDTLVADRERLAINSLASPALASAGSGDVLSGVVSALLARGMDPFAAACAGVLAHARAGRRAAGELGAESVIATDLIAHLPAGLESGASEPCGGRGVGA
jgi:NAD(P)H-hydrate epimerase